jgi:hypothetical protein
MRSGKNLSDLRREWDDSVQDAMIYRLLLNRGFAGVVDLLGGRFDQGDGRTPQPLSNAG